MKYKVLILIFLLANCAYASDIKKDYLNPPLSAFINIHVVTDYYSKVVEVFSKAYESTPQNDGVKLRCIVMPSFNPEYAVGIKQKGSKYYAFKLKAKRSIWADYMEIRENKSKQKNFSIGVDESKVEIPKSIYTVLTKSWEGMTINTKYKKEFAGGLDGVTYYFIDSSLRVGWTWSPNPDTQTGYLVKLSELLGQLSESKDPQKVEGEILDVASRLIESFEGSERVDR